MDFLNLLRRTDKEEGKSQSSSAFGALLKNSIGSKFMSFFQEIVKPALQRSQQQTAATYLKINSFIDEVHAHIEKKLSRHEEEVFEIVRDELREAHREVRELAAELNRNIALKNENEEMWVLSNQLDYFKNEALKLFSANKQLRLENKLLNKTIKEYQIELDSRQLTLQKLKKQTMRQRTKQRAQREVESVRESSILKERGKYDGMRKRRMVTELSSIMQTKAQVERESKELDDSCIHIQVSNASNGQFSNHSAPKLLKNSPILITLEDEDKSVQNVTIPNLSAQSQETKWRHQLLHQRPIYKCLDKCTQTQAVGAWNKQASVEVNEGKNNYHLDLFRNGFRMNVTQIKTRRREIPLRNSLDYDKGSGGHHIKSMKSSFLRGRLVQVGSGSKKGSLLRMAAK